MQLSPIPWTILVCDWLSLRVGFTTGPDGYPVARALDVPFQHYSGAGETEGEAAVRLRQAIEAALASGAVAL